MPVLAAAFPPLQPSPARSNAQTRVVCDTFACTHAQLGVHSPSPLKRTTVGLPRPHAVQVELMAVDDVGASARRRWIRRGRCHHRSDGSADRDQEQHRERRVEKRASRPVVQRPASAPERGDDECRKQQRPEPARKVEEALARHERDDDAREHRSDARPKRPLLWLVREAGGGEGERGEGRAECEERARDCQGSSPPAKRPRTSSSPSASPPRSDVGRRVRSGSSPRSHEACWGWCSWAVAVVIWSLLS